MFGGTLAAFLTNALGFVARPLGAIVFGHLGDRIGRRMTLILTITIMGVATGFIGLLPDYATAGFLGAALLITLRLIQGFSLGGEWGGAILLATESADVKKHGFYAAFPQLGSPIGSILTAALYLSLPLLLSTDDLLSWGWRIPFLIAFPLLVVSLWLRFKIDETPVFTELVEKQQRARVPLAVVFRTKPVALILGVGAALLGIGSYSLMNTYTLQYGASQLGYDYTQLLTATTIGAIGTLIVGGILPTMAWAGLGGLLSELFGARIRYSAISFAYAIAAIISGFVLPLTLTFGEAVYYAWWHPGVVLAAMSLITAVSAFFAARRWSRSRPCKPSLNRRAAEPYAVTRPGAAPGVRRGSA